jgi:malate dehydrogenase (oxaloacetate-decarboxylating)(NADP+)
MKLAAVQALAELARQGEQGLPEEVMRAYEGERFEFGPGYVIPKPFDPRVLIWESSAVAKAAMETGVARIQIDLDEYREELERYRGRSREIMRSIISKAKRQPKRIVFPEGNEDRVLRAVQILRDEEIAEPVLLGHGDDIRAIGRNLGIDLDGVQIIDPKASDKATYYRKELMNLRRRKGVTEKDAERLVNRRSYFGVMMVRMGDAHGLVAGLTKSYPDSVHPALEVVGLAEGHNKGAGVYIAIQKERVLFFADGSLNVEPSDEELASIAGLGAATAEWFGFDPVVAILSFSNFGTVRSEDTLRLARAVRIAKERWPDLKIEGEMQADIALDPKKRESRFPFANVKGEANVLVFPNLHAAHIAVRLMGAVGEASVVGPILMGMRSPVNSLQPTASVEEIVNLTAITVLQAQKEY